MSDWTFEQAAAEVKVAHRLGYWWGTANDPADPITPDELAEADAYLDRWLAEHDAKVRAETWDEAIQAVFDWWSTPEDEQGVIVNPYGTHPADRLMQEIEKEAGQ